MVFPEKDDVGLAFSEKALKRGEIEGRQEEDKEEASAGQTCIMLESGWSKALHLIENMRKFNKLNRKVK